jgi:hypothetical protein
MVGREYGRNNSGKRNSKEINGRNINESKEET